MKTIEQKRMELLQETADHYNRHNRCSANNSCCYSPKTIGLEGISEGCAIGRKISKKLAKKLDSLDYSTVDDSTVFDRLPQKLRELGTEFLQALQSLHDYDGYWDESGLSEYGRKEVENIKNMYCQID